MEMKTAKTSFKHVVDQFPDVMYIAILFGRLLLKDAKSAAVTTTVRKQSPGSVEHLADPLPTVIIIAVLFGILLLQKWLHL